jgi:N-acetylneuraminic acid mutarotase
MKRLAFIISFGLLATVLLLNSCGTDDKKVTPTPPAPPTIATFSPTSELVGGTVVITGTNFSTVANENTVRFNSVQATVSNASATQLTVTVPAGATSGKITVQVANQSVTSTADFVVNLNLWTKKADFPGNVSRLGAVAFSIANKGYFGTGGNAANASVIYSDFWEYDPATDTWTQKANMAGGSRKAAIGFSIGSKGYIGTGNNSTTGGINYTQDFWEYDPANNMWTKKADFGGGGRIAAIAFSMNSKGYVGTGISSAGVQKDFYEYDPSNNTWTKKADFAGVARHAAISFSIGNSGYIGIGSASTNVGLKDFWEYNAANNTWTQRQDFIGNGRLRALGFSIGSKGYVSMGYEQINANMVQLQSDLVEYDPSKNTWVVKAAIGSAPGPRADHVGFSIGNKAYIGIGVSTAGTVRDFWEYTQ